MIAILMLLGVGALAAVVGAFGDDDSDGGNAAVPGQSLTDDDDEVIGADYEAGATSYLADLVSEGEISQATMDGILDEAITEGPMNIDLGAGNDSALGSAGDDTLTGGEGGDYITGGEGDDLVDLGAGDDAYGVESSFAATPEDDIWTHPYDAALYGDEADYEAGDDTIMGGAGADAISDSYGLNEINGQQGDDFIVAVDAEDDGLTPDVVKGGHGNDYLFVDEGDTVTGSLGADEITVDLFDGVAEGYSVVTVTDFNPDEDMLELEGAYSLFYGPDPSGPDDVIETPLSVADVENGEDAIVYISGVPVVLVVGGAGLTTANLSIST